MSDPIIIGPAGVGLRVGSPVRRICDAPNPNEPGLTDLALSQVGVVATTYPAAAHVFWWNLGHDAPVPLGELALDLTDATGRAHAAWYAMGLDHGHIKPARRISSRWDREGVYVVGSPQDAGWASADIVGHPAGDIVPALADLDPTDDTRLFDGSRVVDARALAVVMAHVVGGARG